MGAKTSEIYDFFINQEHGQVWWLTPVILATEETGLGEL
jgi:hypothetical protein